MSRSSISGRVRTCSFTTFHRAVADGALRARFSFRQKLPIACHRSRPRTSESPRPISWKMGIKTYRGPLWGSKQGAHFYPLFRESMPFSRNAGKRYSTRFFSYFGGNGNICVPFSGTIRRNRAPGMEKYSKSCRVRRASRPPSVASRCPALDRSTGLGGRPPFPRPTPGTSRRLYISPIPERAPNSGSRRCSMSSTSGSEQRRRHRDVRIRLHDENELDQFDQYAVSGVPCRRRV